MTDSKEQDSREMTYVRHALNLAFREKDITEHEQTNMLAAWTEAENPQGYGAGTAVSATSTMDKCKKLFGMKFGPKGGQLFGILHKRVDDIREIVKNKRRKQAEEQKQKLQQQQPQGQQGQQGQINAARQPGVQLQQQYAQQPAQYNQPQYVPQAAQQQQQFSSNTQNTNAALTPEQLVQYQRLMQYSQNKTLAPEQQLLLQHLHENYRRHQQHQQALQQQQQQQQQQQLQLQQQQLQQTGNPNQQYTSQQAYGASGQGQVSGGTVITKGSDGKKTDSMTDGRSIKKGYQKLSEEEKALNRTKKKLLEQERIRQEQGLPASSSSSLMGWDGDKDTKKKKRSEDDGDRHDDEAQKKKKMRAGGLGGDYAHEVDAMLEKPGTAASGEYGQLEAVSDLHMTSTIMGGQEIDDQYHLSRESLRYSVAHNAPSRPLASKPSSTPAMQALLSKEAETTEAHRHMEAHMQRMQTFYNELQGRGEEWKYFNVVDGKALADMKVTIGNRRHIKKISVDAEKMISKGVQQFMKDILESCIEMSEIRTCKKFPIVKSSSSGGSANGQGQREGKQLAVQTGPDVCAEVVRKEKRMRQVVAQQEQQLEKEMVVDMRAYDEARAAYLEEASRGKKRAQAAATALESNHLGSVQDFHVPWWVQEKQAERKGELSMEQVAVARLKDDVARKHDLGKYNELHTETPYKKKKGDAGVMGMQLSAARQIPSPTTATTMVGLYNDKVDLPSVSLDPQLVILDDVIETLGRRRVEVSHSTGSAVGISVLRAKTLGRL